MRHIYQGEKSQPCEAQRVQKGKYVDAAGIGGRKMLLPGEILKYWQRYSGKSAEVIVVTETSRQKDKR